MKESRITDFFLQSTNSSALVHRECHDGENNCLNDKLNQSHLHAVSTANPPKKILTVKSTRSQTYLNLGQQDFFNSCPQCLMVFNAAERADVLMHKKYHHSFTRGISIPKNNLNYLLVREIAPYKIFKCSLSNSKVLKKVVYSSNVSRIMR